MTLVHNATKQRFLKMKTVNYYAKPCKCITCHMPYALLWLSRLCNCSELLELIN